MGIFSRIMQEIHQLDQGFLCLVLTGHICECDAGLLLHVHLGSAFSHTTHALHHEIHHNNNQYKRKDKTEQRLDHGHAVLALPADLNTARQQPVGQFIVPLHRNRIGF